MNRTQKSEWVASFNEQMQAAEAVVVCHYSGLSATAMTDLRAKVRETGATIKVSKNRLAKLALEGTDYTALGDLLTGPTAMAWGADPVAVAKVVADFAKENEQLVVLGGAMGTNTLDADGVKQLASLPSLDELRGKLVGLLQAPAQKIAAVTQAPAGQLARVFGAYGKEAA